VQRSEPVAVGSPLAPQGIRLHGTALRGNLVGMTTPLTVSIPHQLGRAEARRRIETGFAKMIHSLPGGIGRGSERWDGDRLVFSVAALAQTVDGVLDVGDTAVTMEIRLPGVLGLLAGGLKDRLQKAGQLLLTKK
jgi:Putative polyhydroxyalkanoic acid system protein (PHA_gran_rgn)